MNKTIKKYRFIFTAPTLLAFLIAFLIPFIYGIYLSFCKFTTVTDASFVGIDNYVRAFTENGDFVHALWFTTKFALIAVLSINVFAFLLALALTRKIRGTNVFRTIFFMPNLIGGIVLGYIWQTIINGVLSQFGETIVNESRFGFWGLIVLMNWQMIGYMMVIYIAAIQNVPNDLIDAAKVDGAGPFQRLKGIIIPLVMPSITICLFLTVSNSFKLFDQNLVLTGGAPLNETRMLALDIFKTFYGKNGYEGVGQAKAVVFFILVAVIAMLQLQITRRKEVET